MAMLMQPLAMAICAIMAIMAIIAIKSMAYDCTNMVMLGIQLKSSKKLLFCNQWAKTNKWMAFHTEITLKMYF